MLAPVPLAAGCGAGDHTPKPQPAKLDFGLPRDTSSVPPDQPVRVAADTGTLRSVTMTGPNGAPVAGRLSPDHRSWRTDEDGLALGATYTLAAQAVTRKGVLTTETVSFTTLNPPASQQVRTVVAPLTGSTVGVGHPIAVKLTNPVHDPAARARVERRLRVSTTPQVEGAWHWFDGTHLNWRPRQFWAPGTRVKLAARLTGVDAGDGAYGGNDQDVTFTVGDAVITTVDSASHRMTVVRNGVVLRTVPVTTGKQGFATRNGIKVILERDERVLMDSRTVGIPAGSPNSYRLNVAWAVRVTNSGEFLHAAPWSVSKQGVANVSHGCVGMSTADAQWYFGVVRRGDVVRVINSQGRGMEPFGNGYGDWNLSWPDWLAGSATGAHLSVPADQG
jgi:lipoprotein-anchoring transpeptidase ErfK/SrfK